MNKYTEMTLICVLSVYLIGCGNSDSQEVNGIRVYDTANTDIFNKVCLDGIQYFYETRKYGSHLAPAFNRDSSIKTCEVE